MGVQVQVYGGNCSQVSAGDGEGDCVRQVEYVERLEYAERLVACECLERVPQQQHQQQWCV